MKNIFVILFVCFCDHSAAQTLQNKMYLPEGAGSDIVDYIPGAPQDWYVNLEKYWYYRYRLVSDFLFIDPTDSPGSSIPAQSRQHGANGNLNWQDATIGLGHYIGVKGNAVGDGVYREFRMRFDNIRNNGANK